MWIGFDVEVLFEEPISYLILTIGVTVCLYIGWLSTDTRPFEGGWSRYLWDQITLAFVLISIVGFVQTVFILFVDFSESRFAFTLSLSDDIMHDDGGFDDDILSGFDSMQADQILTSS